MKTQTASAVTPVELRRLLTASVVYLAFALLGTAVAITRDLPARFLGRTSELTATQDWLYGGGTSLSPPLTDILLFVAFMAIAPRSGKLGWVGAIGLTFFIGALNTFGQLSEPITYEVLAPETFDPFLALIVVGMVVSPFVMFVLGIREIRRRRSAR